VVAFRTHLKRHRYSFRTRRSRIENCCPLLLILDNCEHVIELASLLAEQIYQSAPKTRLLVTSREALRVEGEHVHRLAPLGYPSASLALSLAELLHYPAPSLFVDRASAGGHDLHLTDADVPVIAEICEKLDGIALAIELAAGRVATYGLQRTAELLKLRLSIAWVGRRTAQPRQQTLQATLDWSYNLLSLLEKRAMNRLAIFVGQFSLAAARAVLLGSESDPELALSAIDSLIAKSLLTIDRSGEQSCYRLLEVTRTYGFEKLTVSGEVDMIAARHAAYYADLGLREVPRRLTEAETATSARDHLDNARAALEWSFGPTGDLTIGVRLAAASAPLLERLSLLSECRRWCQRAVENIDQVPAGQSTELELQAALGLSLMFTQGNSDATGVALRRALTIAEQRGDRWNQLRLLGRLHIFDERIGDFDQSLVWAERANRVAMGMGEPEALGVSNSLLGVAYHLMGDQAAARSALEQAMLHRPTARRGSSVYYGFDHGNRAGITLARTLWLQGSYARSRELTNRIVEEAAWLDQPITLCMALIGAITIDLIAGVLDGAEMSLNRFIAQAETHALGPYLTVGEGLKGELALKRGDVTAGVAAIEACLIRVRAARYEVLTTEFNSALAEGLAKLGRAEEALQLINETIAQNEKGGEHYAMPELLRIQAGLAGAAGREDEHEAILLRSLDWSRRQGALTWELRAAKDLARLWIGRGQEEAAPELLHRLLGQFTDDVETEDLRQSRMILAGLASRMAPRSSRRA
jgi:predicted ATPase